MRLAPRSARTGAFSASKVFRTPSTTSAAVVEGGGAAPSVGVVWVVMGLPLLSSGVGHRLRRGADDPAGRRTHRA